VEVKRKKLTPEQKARIADKGLSLVDAFLKGLGKSKKKRKGTGALAGGFKPDPCGKCD